MVTTRLQTLPRLEELRREKRDAVKERDAAVVDSVEKEECSTVDASRDQLPTASEMSLLLSPSPPSPLSSPSHLSEISSEASAASPVRNHELSSG